MRYWIFKCNPEKYRILDRLSDPNPIITWTVTRYRDEISPGDIVFLWMTGKERGIRAVILVEKPPAYMAEIESERPYWATQNMRDEWRITATITHRDINLSHVELRADNRLGQLSVFRGFQQATNFKVTDNEGAVLMQLLK